MEERWDPTVEQADDKAPGGFAVAGPVDGGGIDRDQRQPLVQIAEGDLLGGVFGLFVDRQEITAVFGVFDGDLTLGFTDGDGGAGIDDLLDTHGQRRFHRVASALGFSAQKLRLVEAPEVVECGGVEECVAVYEGGLDTRAVQYIAAHDFHTPRFKRVCFTGGSRHYADLFAAVDEGAYERAADKAGAAGY